MSKRSKPTLGSAVKAVDRNGLLLVFAVKNRQEIPSLWSEFYPRSKMKWEWDEDGDQRVANLWHLREKISSSKKIVYAKWFQGRATLISKEVFPYLLCALNSFDDRIECERDYLRTLSSKAREILKLLEDNSPLSTREIKNLSDLKGRGLESEYQKALSELWRRLLIVGTGEVDDGAFPSLAISATRIFFEEEWLAAQDLPEEESLDFLRNRLGESSVFLKYFYRLKSKLRLEKAKHIETFQRSTRNRAWVSADEL